MIKKTKRAVVIAKKQLLVFFLANLSLQKNCANKKKAKLIIKQFCQLFSTKRYASVNARSLKVIACSNFK